MRETKQRTVDGRTVFVTQHPARAAARLLAKIGRAVAPAFAKIKAEHFGVDLTKKPEEIEVTDVDLMGFVPCIEALLVQLSDDAADALIVDVLKHTTVSLPDAGGKLRVYDLSKADEIDDAFTGNLLLMWKVMGAALEVNFGPFSGARGFLTALVRTAAERSSTSSSPTSSESSGTPSS